MLCLVRYLFVISTSVIDCLGRFVPEMTYYVLSGTLNLTKLKLKLEQQEASQLTGCDFLNTEVRTFVVTPQFLQPKISQRRCGSVS